MVKNLFLKITEIFYRTWKAFKPLRKIVILFFLFSLLTITISIIIFPSWLNNNREFVRLLVSVLLVGIALLSDIIKITTSVITENRKIERTLKAFRRETNNSERVLEPKLRGIPDIIKREESEQIIEQLRLGRPVLVTGEAGSGKSGIAVDLVLEAKRRKIFPLLIDARRLVNFDNPFDLRRHFDIDEPFMDVIESAKSGARRTVIPE